MSKFRIKDSHPYGVLPSGNLYITTDEEKLLRRRRGLGRFLNSITDESLLEVLSFLTNKELARISLASKALYVYSHHSDLWRDLTLQTFLDEVVVYMESWKETFVSTWHRKFNLGKHFPHVPLQVSGIYSNLLHRSWVCHSCDLETACPGFYSFSDIAKVDAASLSMREFVENWEAKNVPLVIQNAVKEWKAFERWNPAYLASVAKDKKFRATSATAPVAATFTLQEYFNYARQAQEEAPLYLFERNFCKAVPSLTDDFSVPLFFSPPHQDEIDTSSGVHYSTDLFRLFGDKRPDYRWLICGPARSGSIFHIDPNQTNAWNVSITGRKKWIFYPPGVPPPGVVADAAGAEVTVPISTGEWLLSFWKAHLECRRDPDVSKRPTEMIVNAGELVFVPHGYWHMVVNLDDCIALTQNYVSTCNLADCLRFLRDTPDQISGVRDRSSDAIQPDEFYETFLERLAEELPPAVLDEAIEESKRDPLALDAGTLKRIQVFELNKRNKRKKTTAYDDSPCPAGGRADPNFTFSFF